MHLFDKVRIRIGYWKFSTSDLIAASLNLIVWLALAYWILSGFGWTYHLVVVVIAYCLILAISAWDYIEYAYMYDPKHWTDWLKLVGSSMFASVAYIPWVLNDERKSAKRRRF